jgi:2-keto-4-pentenoate hydratase
VQRQLGVDRPDFGVLFAELSPRQRRGDVADALLQPKVEAEVALVIDRDLDLGDHTVADVIGSVAYVLPAIEIVDSRIAGWDITFVDTVADNASSGRFVLGAVPVPLDGLDLAGWRCR